MGPVEIRFVGSGDAFGSGGRFQTCIAVRSSDDFFLIDCGASSLVAMRQQKLEPRDVSKIFITHLHGDHFGGLPFCLLEPFPPAAHPPPLPRHTSAGRIDGKTFVYSGDTQWTDALIEASAGADLFACECYVFDEDVPLHDSHADIMENRSRMTCRRIIVTHMNEDMLSRVGEIELEAAEDGKAVVL